MTSDLARVRGWFESGLLLHPTGGEANTVDLSRALAELTGGGEDGGPQARELAQRIGPADHYVLALIDGLGMNLIEAQDSQAFLRGHLDVELRAVFPATTATALTSLATGLWPSEHAVPGWWTYLPEPDITATVLPFIERFSGRPLQRLGLSADQVFTHAHRRAFVSHPRRSFLPRAIATGAYTGYVTADTPVEPYDTLPEAIDAVAARIAEASGPTYSYLYYPGIDSLQHTLGPNAEAVREHLALVDRELARLASRLPASARLIVTADHGLLDATGAPVHVLSPDDELLPLLAGPPHGEPRVPMFRVPSEQHEEFQERFRERFGETFALLAIAEVEELELFGPGKLSQEARARIGDFIGLTASSEVLVYDARLSRRPHPAGGAHPARTGVGAACRPAGSEADSPAEHS